MGESRTLAHYDAIADEELSTEEHSDWNGHSSHVAGVVINSDSSDPAGKYRSMAPDVDLVVVRAFDREGRGSYADVIRGIDWLVVNKDYYGIRVLNLSFSAEPRSRYWDDPLNQAVMAAWQAGIVVVVSAGNTGPEAMSIGAPGNVPYVITVGAMTDNYTPEDLSDDRLASFSSAGPTKEAFVKPDLVAPGGHLTSILPLVSTLAIAHPEFHDGDRYFTMSGTSQAAGVVTGIAALILQQSPWLTPDDVKCRLMSTSHLAIDGEGNLAYSLFQQGAGLADAYAAVHSESTGCANQGLDVSKDLAGIEHYSGRARQDENGNYTIEGLDGFLWNDAFSGMTRSSGMTRFCGTMPSCGMMLSFGTTRFCGMAPFSGTMGFCGTTRFCGTMLSCGMTASHGATD